MGMSLINKDAKDVLAYSARPCNTSEMTLERVLGLVLGILFDCEEPLRR